jgi:hypothetical protein
MLTTVENLVEEDRYDQVLNVIEAYLEDDPVEAHAPIAREQRALLTECWDRYVRRTHHGFLKRLDALVDRKIYTEAEREITLFATDLAKMSPWTTAHLVKYKTIIAEEK